MKNYSNIKVLLIEDEEFDVRRVKNTLKLLSGAFDITEVLSDGTEALDYLKENPSLVDIVIMDYQIAGGIMGELLITNIKNINPLIQVIVITKHTINITDFDFANNLIEAGAFWYCTKYPGDIEEFIYQPTDFIISMLNAYQKKLLERSSQISYQKLNNKNEEILQKKRIIGNSSFTKDLLGQIDKLARSNVNVLITGASGTGKELVATHIHHKSTRKLENFIAINCGSIPEDLIESELFGYEKGAFTGANSAKKGLFELANCGTIFLDEVTDLPLSAQVKLLRVLQEGELEKIGRTRKIEVDVRVISATNKKIETEVMEKRFREDLYYRLNVVPLRILSLSERRDDIPELIDYFVEFYSNQMGFPKPLFEKEALEYALNYSWPGNVRELRNFVQRILYYSDGVIKKYDVEKSLEGSFLSPGNQLSTLNFLKNDGILNYNEALRKFKLLYFDFIRRNSSSDADAAKKMGMAPPNFHRMSKELGLK